jgi:hypothetical protein
MTANADCQRHATCGPTASRDCQTHDRYLFVIALFFMFVLVRSRCRSPRWRLRGWLRETQRGGAHLCQLAIRVFAGGESHPRVLMSIQSRG